jgi:pimeloyl-ACP methyl ester carboxylesterase
LTAYLLWPISTPPFLDGRRHELPHSIATIETWPINGIAESVIIRGRDVSNPVLVWIHGGPGQSETPIVRHFNAALEDHFVMVYWDQRYAGRSLDPFGPKPKRQQIDDYVRDLNVLIADLRKRLRCGKVVLVAHSWGTVPGILYAEQHPEDVAAYVGIGQEADTPVSEARSYAWVLSQARSRKDYDVVSRLTRMAPPGRGSGWTPRDLLARYGGAFHADLSVTQLALIGATASETNWRDAASLLFAKRYNQEIESEEARVVLDKGHLRFHVPIIFISGRFDRTVDADLAHQYFERISAPRKAFFWFENSGHYPPFEEPKKFNATMVNVVLPISRSTNAAD